MKSTLSVISIALLLYTVSLSGSAFQIRSHCSRRIIVAYRHCNAAEARIISSLTRRPCSCSSAKAATSVFPRTNNYMSTQRSNDTCNDNDDDTRSTPFLPPSASLSSAAVSTKTNMQTVDNDNCCRLQEVQVDKRGEERRRRSFLKICSSMASIIPLITITSSSDVSIVASALDEIKSGTATTTTEEGSNIRRILSKMVTNKVYMDVRISRADGTFYVRDNETGNDEDPFYGRLVIGLFGKRTPNHVQQFLKYVTNGESYDVNNPLPSYSTSKFPLLDSSSGLLIGGKVSEREYRPYYRNWSS